MKTSKVLTVTVLGAVLVAGAFAAFAPKFSLALSGSGVELAQLKSQFTSPAPSSVAVVEFAAEPSAADLSRFTTRVGSAFKVSRLDSFDSSYFRRAYEVSYRGSFADLQAAVAMSGVKVVRIERALDAELTSLVVPAALRSVPGQDPLLGYQWALSNDGQKIEREIDDIHNETIVADANGPRMDIGLKGVRARLDKELKKNLVVAVIDSGLDTAHEDIKNNIQMNTKECDGGLIPFGAAYDKDGNGYAGDCMGWNFTSKEEAGDNQVEDDLGHGTHVAGIIAAQIGNGIGISGVSNKIKILPIKVTGLRDASKTITTRAAKAILYAIKMKVDVINMSLGWPAAADAQFLRESFEAAHKAGITIVAAAGNNTSAAPVFPCSYENVICVGAVTLSGEVANFSNYGGHVNMMAPGEAILSLFPKSRDPEVFNLKGYEIKNGTSQAAPYVAAQAAVLKGLIPGITPDEIQARLALSSKVTKWGKKFALHGVTDAAAALTVAAQPQIEPVFKNVYQIPYTMANKAFSFKVPVKNFWQASKATSVEVSFDSANLTLSTATFNLGAVGASESKTIEVAGTIGDTSDRRETKMHVKVTADGKTSVYDQQIVLTRELINDRSVKTYPISLLSSRADLPLASIRSLRESDDTPDFAFVDDVNGAPQVKLVRYHGGQFNEERAIVIPGAKQILFAYRVDLNYDGVSDYLIASSAGEEKAMYVQLTYLNSDLQPMFGRQSTLKITREGAWIDEEATKTLAFIAAQTPFGKIAVPLFKADGRLPKEDTNPDAFAFEANTDRSHIYYFEPRQLAGAWILATRAYDNTAWLTAIRAQLQVPFRQTLEVSTILPQTPADFAAGRAQMLVSLGVSTLKNYRLMAVTGVAQAVEHGFQVSPTQFKGQTFEASMVGSAVSLGSVVPVANSQPTFASFYTAALGRVTMLNASNPARIEATQKVTPSRAQDNLLGFIQGYTTPQGLVAFYQSKSNLIMRAVVGGRAVQLQEPIDRSSLLPGREFSASFFPITAGDSRSVKVPAMYIDASSIFGNRVYTWTFADGKLTAPMNLNVAIPKGCRPLAPRRFGAGGQMAYVFLCQSGEGPAAKFALKTLDVE